MKKINNQGYCMFCVNKLRIMCHSNKCLLSRSKKALYKRKFNSLHFFFNQKPKLCQSLMMKYLQIVLENFIYP